MAELWRLLLGIHCSTTIICAFSSANLELFIGDVIRTFGYKRVCVVHSQEDLALAKQPNPHVTTATPLWHQHYSYSRGTAQEFAGNLFSSVVSGWHDAVFLAGKDHGELLRMLSEAAEDRTKLEPLKSASQRLTSEISWFLEEGLEFRALELRLDTMVFHYSKSNETHYRLRESYGFEGRWAVSRTFAHWRAGFGVEFEGSSSVWERRSDLRGVELTNAMIDWPPVVLMERGVDKRFNT